MIFRSITQKFYIILTTSLILSAGCIPLYYSTNAENVPLFREQWDTDFAVGLRLGSMSFGGDFQGAMAVADHVGIMANANLYGSHWNTTGPLGAHYEGSHTGSLLEIGAGYFTKLNEKTVFETYGGFGWGIAKNNFGESIDAAVKYHRFFIQPAIGWYFKYVNIGVSARVSFPDYYKFEYDNTISQSDKEIILDLDNHTYCFIEPAFTIRAGSENVKFKGQVVLSMSPNYMEASQITYDPVSFSLGLIFNLRKKNYKTGTTQ